MNMPRYDIKFLKTVYNDIGHQTVACQRSVVVEADSAEAAVPVAKAQFCDLENIPYWSLRSEAFEVQEIPASPAAPRWQRAPAAARA
jgi:hypothetical protein